MPRAIVLGGGLVGSVIAADLAQDNDFDVVVADSNSNALKAAENRSQNKISTIQVDLADEKATRNLVADFDIVLGALASPIGFQTLRAVIEAGKNYCDICFMPEDAMELDELAKNQGVTAVVDCGVAPGMSNLLAGYGSSLLDKCENIEIYVGGIPRDPKPPFYYKAAFSPHDVIEEYTRPARLVEKGKVVIREALSEIETINLPGVGDLDAFNTDGLRSLAYTMNAPMMKEKTLRYPGHIQLMCNLRHAGFFSSEPIKVGESEIRPLDVTSELMYREWSYAPGEEDLTVMRIIVEGLKDDCKLRYTWDLLDYYDKPSQTTSMSRTTAFPCAIIARLIAKGKVKQLGVLPPELLGSDAELVSHVLSELESRGIKYTQTKETL